MNKWSIVRQVFLERLFGYLTNSLLFHVKRKLRATKIAINEKLSLSHRFIASFFLHFSGVVIFVKVVLKK